MCATGRPAGALPDVLSAAESGFRSDSDFAQHPDDTAGNNVDLCPDDRISVG